jgi:hypothetical protein
MHLLYVDESGKSGPQDFDQPWYVLGGLVVHEDQWERMETALNTEIDRLVPPPRADTWEIHMSQLYHGKGFFRSMSSATRFALVDAVFDVMDRCAATLIFIGIDKKAHYGKYKEPQPVEDLAYRFMLERFNNFLSVQTDKRGVVVSDEQKEVELATRRAHSQYRRLGTGATVINHVIETPFFTPSHWSRMLQIIDVATYYVARHLRGASTAAYWPRIEKRLNCYPDYTGKGLKTFP